MVCYQRLILSLAAVAALVGMGGESFAQSKPMRSPGAKSNFEKVLRRSFAPTRLNSVCYAQTNTARKFDLTRLCGAVTSESNLGGTDGGVSSSSGSSNPKPSGTCNVASDIIASDGSRCGGRAASEKKGGR
jgi:hypothetical protein